MQRYRFERLAGNRALEEEPGGNENGERYADGEEALVAAADRAELEPAQAERIGHGHRIRRKDGRDDLAVNDYHAKERQDRREERRALLHQRPHDHALARPADHEHDGERDQHAERIRPLVLREQEHTSELQSPYVISYAVFCLKKTT